MATAAVAVTLVSLPGFAAITGIIPNSHGTAAPAVPVADPVRMTSSAPPVASERGPALAYAPTSQRASDYAPPLAL